MICQTYPNQITSVDPGTIRNPPSVSFRFVALSPWVLSLWYATNAMHKNGVDCTTVQLAQSILGC